MKPIRCMLGWHDWMVMHNQFEDTPECPVTWRECKRCDAEEML